MPMLTDAGRKKHGRGPDFRHASHRHSLAFPWQTQALSSNSQWHVGLLVVAYDQLVAAPFNYREHIFPPVVSQKLSAMVSGVWDDHQMFHPVVRELIQPPTHRSKCAFRKTMNVDCQVSLIRCQYFVNFRGWNYLKSILMTATSQVVLAHKAGLRDHVCTTIRRKSREGGHHSMRESPIPRSDVQNRNIVSRCKTQMSVEEVYFEN